MENLEIKPINVTIKFSKKPQGLDALLEPLGFIRNSESDDSLGYNIHFYKYAEKGEIIRDDFDCVRLMVVYHDIAELTSKDKKYMKKTNVTKEETYYPMISIRLSKNEDKKWIEKFQQVFDAIESKYKTIKLEI